jgi:putative ABC transport system permease protein
MKRSLRSWLWRVPLNQEVDEEIAFHVEMRTRELVEAGMDPRIAREMVLARLGDVGRLKRTCVDLGRKRDREMRVTQWFEEFRADVMSALRQMKAAPGFTLVAALTLALGIGANSAIFALADATFLRPLPFTAPHDRLVMIWERFPNGFLSQVSPLDFNDWADQNRSFDAMAAFLANSVSMIGPDGAPEQVTAQMVSARFFDLLGVTPIAGQTFVPSDAVEPNTVVLSEGFWRRRFGADPTVVGRSITIAGRAQTVIGIVPDEFRLVPATISNAGSEPPSLWTVFNYPRGGDQSQRGAHYMYAVGRIKEGVTFDAAQSDMTAIGTRNEELYPQTNKGHIPTLQPLREGLVGSEMRLTSMLLLAVVGFVLLMCCANVANLLLARTIARARELAVRSALGATRRRIVSQILTESLVLAALGGLGGMVFGAAVLKVAPSLVPPGLLPSAVSLAFDGRVMGFCAFASLSVGLAFGLAPAWQTTGLAVVQAMGTEGRSTRRGGRFRSVLVVAEVAAAVLVLCGASLLLRTLISLQSVESGSRAQDALTMVLNLPVPNGRTPTRYESREAVSRFFDSVQREVAQTAGVLSVAIGGVLPLDGMWTGQLIDIEGDPPRQGPSRNLASYHMVSPTYFETLDIPILSGRVFTQTDGADAVQVCIVSEVFVQRYLNGRNPIGLRVNVPAMGFPMRPVLREIVGVARQIKMWPNEPQGPIPQLYVPIAQNAWYSASLIVRPQAGPAEALLPAVQSALARVDNQQPVTRVRTIDVVASEATSRPRFRAVLVGTFAALALGLAMVGVFGVLAYSVQQRVREFGVRIAMGADASDVMRLVLGNAARLMLIGLTVGLIAAAALTRYLATFLYNVQPLDPITFVAVPVVLIVTAAIAVAAPAWRAARVEPVVAFRAE